MALLCGGGGDGGGAEPIDPVAAKINAEAGKAAKQTVEVEKKIIKMLLLGAGESGKSTIFKQMKIINKDGYSEAERKTFKAIVHSNTVSSMKTLVGAFELLEVKVPANIQSMCDTLPEDETLTPDVAATIKSMWEDEKVQEIFGRKSEFQLNDSADYYFNKVTTLGDPGYVPDEQDVLRSRVRTTGIVQTDFKIKALDFAMFDVGGQRNERRKWIHAFDNVHAVIFVAALSEYDQVLFEDNTMNRMVEAISLFDQIVNSRWFASTSMILFLNKKDLFEMKLKKANIKDHFEDYDGADGGTTDAYNEGSAYFKEKFLEKSKNKEKTIYPHITCATDTKNVSFVFNAVIGIILEINMKQSGLA